MAGLQTYGQFYVFVDQQLLEQEIDVDFDYNPDHKPVVTMARGYAGITKGAGSMTATVTNAVPRVGLEMNYFELAQKGTFVDFIVTMGGKQLISKGTITGVKGKGGAGSESRIDFTFHGGEPTVK